MTGAGQRDGRWLATAARWPREPGWGREDGHGVGCVGVPLLCEPPRRSAFMSTIAGRQIRVWNLLADPSVRATIAASGFVAPWGEGSTSLHDRLPPPLGGIRARGSHHRCRSGRGGPRLVETAAGERDCPAVARFRVRHRNCLSAGLERRAAAALAWGVAVEPAAARHEQPRRRAHARAGRGGGTGRRAAIAIARGKWVRAEGFTDRALRVIRRSARDAYPTSAFVYAVDVRVALRRGETQRAQELLIRARGLGALDVRVALPRGPDSLRARPGPGRAGAGRGEDAPRDRRGLAPATRARRAIAS